MISLITLGLLTLADGPYVGSKACAGCHGPIYTTYVRTAMGRSLRRADSPEQLALAPQPVRVGRFKIFRRGDSLYQSEVQEDAFGAAIGEADYKLEYVIGSGANGFAYIITSGQRLAEAPLSYYTRSKTWDLSPGYSASDPGFQRPIAPACAACHSGRSRPVANRLGLYEVPPFPEMPIGCENCHGPGRNHILAPSKGSIVNPARLLPARQASVCAQCHQNPGAPADSDLLAHDSSMRQSKCYLGSGGRLTCTMCHNPHAAVPPNEAAAFYRSKCLTCHATSADHGTMCTDCHMPKRRLGEVPHTALTNHRIPARL